MTDTIRELINHVLDYVARTPGACFEIRRFSRAVTGSANCRCHFRFIVYNRLKNHFVGRYGNQLWSSCADLTEDNLRYLVEQLEGERK